MIDKSRCPSCGLSPYERGIGDYDISRILAERNVALRDLARVIYLAQKLHEMVPREVWRDTGGDDMQGHYEGDYHAEQVWAELESLAGMSGIPNEGGSPNRDRNVTDESLEVGGIGSIAPTSSPHIRQEPR